MDWAVIDGSATVTAEGIQASEGATESAWQRFFGTDPTQVRLAPGKVYRIRGVCEILTAPSGTLQFSVRTARGGWEHHDKGVVRHGGGAGTVWTLDETVV